MIKTLEIFHNMVDSIWKQECEQEEFMNTLQQVAQTKGLLWAGDLMQVEEELRIQFFMDLQRLEYISAQVLQPEAIRETNEETRTYYGYLSVFLSQYSNDLPLLYFEFPFQYPVHISCSHCDNDLHSVLVNPTEFNEKNTTTVMPIYYNWKKDGLHERNEKNEEYLIQEESRKPEESGTQEELVYKEWDFFENSMRILDACEEKYLQGIMNYLYGMHKCTRCGHTEQVIDSYRKWFYENQPNFDEPKKELIHWIEEQAKKGRKAHNKELEAFWYRMAAWYEKSRNVPDMELFYNYVISYYMASKSEGNRQIGPIKQVVQELLETPYDILKIKAYNCLFQAYKKEQSATENGNWKQCWETGLKSVSLCQKVGCLTSAEYESALYGLSLIVAENGVGDIDLIDELLTDYVAIIRKSEAQKEQVGMAYERLAYMWAEGAGDYEKCYGYFQQCMDIFKEVYGADSEYVADLYETLAKYHKEDGRERKACELQERALEIRVKELGNIYLFPPIFKEIAVLAAKITSSIDEEEVFHRVMAVALSYLNLASSYYEIQVYQKAMDCVKKSLALYEGKMKRFPNSSMAAGHKLKGDIYQEVGNEKAAEKEYQEAVEICQKLMELNIDENEREECLEILNDLDVS